MPELLDRRKKDLEDQLGVLTRELAHWETISADGEAFEKHHSQIAALSRQMTELNEKVRSEWGGSGDFVMIQKAQRDCGAVHTIWNYFREKLLMRADPYLGVYLRAADAYVWACYEPLLRRWRAAHPDSTLREPPLVTFDTDRSPWALSRQGKYMPLGDKTGATGGAIFADTLAKMPIAILGIPWSTMELLPNLAALAHETGHIVESDFNLENQITQALDAATQTSSLCQGWSVYWQKEVFADLFACYTAGPSFVWVLADNIPDSPQVTSGKVRPVNDQWGVYPPATLRMLLNLYALEHLGHRAAAARIERYWKGDYLTHAMTAFEPDVKAVVPAFYAAADLPQDLNYTEQAVDAARASRAVTARSDLRPTERYDPRALVGVASEVHRSPPAGVDTGDVWRRLQQHIVSSRPPGVLAQRKQRGEAVASAQLRTTEITSLLFAAPADEDE